MVEPQTTQPDDARDLDAIDELTLSFFALFGNKNGRQVQLQRIFELCIPSAIIIRTCGSEPEVSSLEAFIEPRQSLLTDGRLTDFEEAELEGTTRVFGAIAQRFCLFRKSGVLNGQAFETCGWKTIQFVRMSQGWRISAVAWDEEAGI